MVYSWESLSYAEWSAAECALRWEATAFAAVAGRVSSRQWGNNRAHAIAGRALYDCHACHALYIACPDGAITGRALYDGPGNTPRACSCCNANCVVSVKLITKLNELSHSSAGSRAVDGHWQVRTVHAPHAPAGVTWCCACRAVAAGAKCTCCLHCALLALVCSCLLVQR